jgi:hypothetical protein
MEKPSAFQKTELRKVRRQFQKTEDRSQKTDELAALSRRV